LPNGFEDDMATLKSFGKSRQEECTTVRAELLV
jgi:hypothetical protein